MPQADLRPLQPKMNISGNDFFGSFTKFLSPGERSMGMFARSSLRSAIFRSMRDLVGWNEPIESVIAAQIVTLRAF